MHEGKGQRDGPERSTSGGEGVSALLSTGHERVDCQTVLINALRQLKRLIAVFGLKGNLCPNQAVQRAAAFPSAQQAEVFKTGDYKLIYFIPRLKYQTPIFATCNLMMPNQGFSAAISRIQRRP